MIITIKKAAVEDSVLIMLVIRKNHEEIVTFSSGSKSLSFPEMYI
jgi:hypothetical protein